MSGSEIIESLRTSAVARARSAGDAQAAAELEALTEADLADVSRLSILFKWLPLFSAADLDFLRSRGALLGSPQNPASIAAADFYASNPDPRSPDSRPFSLLKLWPSVYGFDARASGYDLPVPFFVVQGRDDTRTPSEAARVFVDEVRAPAKGYVAIEGGHFACFSNPTGFLDALDSGLRGLGIK